MIMLAWFLLAMIILAILQSTKLVYQKHWGELAAFAVLWFAATTYASLIILDVQIPNPNQIINTTLSWLYGFIGVNTPTH